MSILSLCPIHLYSENLANDSLKKVPVIVEAEFGSVGSGFSVGQEGNIKYIAPKTSFSGQAGPADTSRVITFNVTFQDSGYYRLFARVRVGSGGYDDDSFFAGKGFGVKRESVGDDWVMVNGLASGGFTASTDVVEDAGSTGTQIWKWINVSKNFFSGSLAKQAFFVPKDSLSRIFQIGSREDGFYIDKLAFGKADLYYTVKMLDNVLPGSITIPKIDSSNYYQGPPLAQGLTKFLGNVMASDNIYANYWNQITPGNEGKWGSIASTSDSTKWNWTGADNLYNYAKSHSIIFKYHTLIWGQQQPSWISSLDQATQLKYIETWIKKVGQRYPDMELIDVVNEAIATHNPPDGNNSRANYKAALGGDGTTGYDWVIKSFELARAYIPKAKLLLNDYGIINDNNATTIYLTIINLLKDRGLIDGIGVQGHRFEFESASTTTLKNNLDRLAATGLPVYISEMDLGNLNNSGAPDDAVQLQLYQKVFPVVWEHSAVKGITLWGYLEGEMWQSTCHLVMKDGTWRPAMRWIADYLKSTTSVGRTPSMPGETILNQNYPNPFSSYTNISFSLLEPGNVSLKIYNILGREVATLVDGDLEAGIHSVIWDTRSENGDKHKTGIYYYKMVAGQNSISKKMMLIE